MKLKIKMSVLGSLPVIRSIGKTTPAYHLGTIWENRLGLQVLRVLFKHLLWRTRPHRVGFDSKRQIEILNRDGVIAIENFLSEDDFQIVLEEYEKGVARVELRPYKNIENAKLFRTQVAISDDSDAYPRIIKLFQKNRFLRDIASGVIHRKIKNDPAVFLDKYVCSNIDGIDNDIENILHADLHTPTIKMFFYVSAADENNGAFVYAKGSQKLTWARLRHEFELSIRQARLAKGESVLPNLLEKRGEETRNIISPKLYKKMNVKETQLNVKPNTLVICNNMGFHRRGEFLTETPRKALLINFRNSEKVFF